MMRFYFSILSVWLHSFPSFFGIINLFIWVVFNASILLPLSLAKIIYSLFVLYYLSSSKINRFIVVNPLTLLSNFSLSLIYFTGTFFIGFVVIFWLQFSVFNSDLWRWLLFFKLELPQYSIVSLLLKSNSLFIVYRVDPVNSSPFWS